MDNCQYNKGSEDTPNMCQETPYIKYKMDGKLSDVCLCKTHSIHADNSDIVKHHLRERILL